MNDTMFYVYVLRCSDGTLYTGYTDDIRKRLKLHHDGKASKYTRSRLPVKLVTHWTFSSKSDAMRYEVLFKHLSRTTKMEQLAAK